MVLEDDRSAEEKKTHSVLVVGTDKFMSGWGKAAGGKSYAAWACLPEDADHVLQWVESRKDMKRVRVVYGSWHPKGTGHAHIYRVDRDHAALTVKVKPV